ncbi:MAG TPA: hypothetical protein VGJ29_10080 [Vicinamibacterales bacterium]
METSEFCREIEAYLCQKNDGHLIRVVGPSFELVSRWAADGVPLKVAFRGIDRYFERYYRKGPRRRPVKVDFCEADVFDAFDEWRKAIGLPQSSVASHQSSVDSQQSSVHGRQSLPAHVERVVMRLTQARASGVLPAAFDDLIDRVARELDVARAGVRGDARRAVIERLAALDAELMEAARRLLDDVAMAELRREANDELAPFRDTMMPDAFSRAREAAIDRLIRDRLGLPVVRFS